MLIMMNILKTIAYLSMIHEQLNSNEPLTEPEAFTEYSGIQSQVTTNEQDDDEFVDSLLNNNNEEFYSNQPYFVNENEGPRLSSNSQIHVADNDIPNVRLGGYFF